MEHYDILSVAGEGSYGIVMKCRHKNTKKLVAIKKLVYVENNTYIKKMAYREIRILKKLQHENLVKLLDVLKNKKRFYLVFEYLDRTVLDDLEANPTGIGEERTKEYMFQLIRAIEYCHNKNVIHRDIKPENLLVSKSGTLKLCDFGFARMLNDSYAIYTEYIATRWYRAPELLVRDQRYGKPIDIWAIGCVITELLTGEPLFPGDSDVDQLYKIMKALGKLCPQQQSLLSNNMNKQNIMIEKQREHSEIYSLDNVRALQCMFPSWSKCTLNLVAGCLTLDPNKRLSAVELCNHEYFEENNFKELFVSRVYLKVKRISKSPLVPILEPVECDIKESLNNFTTPITDSGMKTPPPVTVANLAVKSPICTSRKSSNNIGNFDVRNAKSKKNCNTMAEVTNRFLPIKAEFHSRNMFEQLPKTPELSSHYFTYSNLKVYGQTRDFTQCLPKTDIKFKKEDVYLQKCHAKNTTKREINLPILHFIPHTERIRTIDLPTNLKKRQII